MNKNIDVTGVNFILKVLLLTLLSITVLSLSLNADAAQLSKQFRDDNGDLICVYQSHFHDVYVNVGFTGTCHFTIEDD